MLIQIKNFLETLMGGGLILLPFSIALGVSTADIIVGIAVISFLGLCFINQDFSWSRPLWVKLALILWGYVSIRIFMDAPTLKSNSSLFLWPRFFLLALAYQYYLSKYPNTHRWILASLGVAVTFLVGDLFLQLLTGQDIFHRPSLGSQLTGPYKMPRAGMTLVLIVFPVLGFLWHKVQQNFSNIVFYGVAMLILGTVIFFTGERMALLLYLFGNCIFWLYYLKINLVSKISIGLSTLILTLGTILFLGHNPTYINTIKSPHIQRHLVKTAENISHFKDHIYGMNIISSWEFFLKAPITGIGKRNFYEMCAKKHPENPGHYCAQHPHNMYFEFLTEFGLIGFILFFGLLIAGCKELTHNWTTLKSNPIYIGLLITLFLKLWPITVTTSFFNAWGGIPFWMTFGWTLGMSRVKAVSRP